MKTLISIRMLAISAIAGLSFGAHAAAGSSDQGKTCKAIFDANRAAIESMAAKRNSAGIQGLFTVRGCPGTQVNVARLPLPSAKQLARVKCTFKLIPPTIECTFGAAASPVQSESY